MSLNHIVSSPQNPIVAQTELPGLDLPLLYYSGGVWTRIPPSQCSGCAKASGAGNHKVWEHVSIAGHQKAICAEFQSGGNNLEMQRRCQALTSNIHLVCNGVVDPEITDGSAHPYPLSFLRGHYRLVSVTAGGYSVTLQWNTAHGGQSPKAIFHNDDNWIEELVDGVPTMVNHPIARYECFPLPCVMKMYESSVMSDHAGWIAYAIDADDDIQDGDTFVVHLATPIGDLAMDLRPDEEYEAEVYPLVDFHMYLSNNYEPWVEPRNTYYLNVIPATYTVESPAQELYALVSKRIYRAGDPYVRVYRTIGGVRSLHAAWAALVHVEHLSNNYSFRTVLDLTTASAGDLTGVTQVDVEVLVEDATNIEAIAVPGRCFNVRKDYTLSHWNYLTVWDNHYCAVAELLRDETGGMEALNLFNCQCCNTRCGRWKPDEAEAPNITPDYATQILQDHPWYSTLQPGDPEAVPTYDRAGCPSIKSNLSALNLVTQIGVHETHDFQSFSGGLTGRTIIAHGGGNETVEPIVGNEWMLQNATKTNIEFADDTSYPELGPMAMGSVYFPQTGNGETANDVNDLGQVVRSRSMLAPGVCEDKYDGTRTGDYLYQRTKANYEVHIPVLDADASEHARNNGITVQRGWFDANGAATTEGLAVYHVKIHQTEGVLFDRATTEPTVESVTTVSTYSTSFSSGLLTMVLKPKSVTYTSIVDGNDVAADIMTGGNVELPECFRDANWTTGTVSGHRHDCVEVGHAIVFTDAKFDGTPLEGKKFLVERARAYGRSDVLQCGFTESSGNLGTDLVLFDERFTDVQTGVPAGLVDYYQWSDEIRVIDENGAIADEIAAHGQSWFDGVTYGVSRKPIAYPGTLAIKTATPNDGLADRTVDATIFAADGTYLLDDDVAAGDCIIVRGTFFSRVSQKSIYEIDNIRDTIDRSLADYGVMYGSANVGAYANYPLSMYFAKVMTYKYEGGDPRENASYNIAYTHEDQGAKTASTMTGGLDITAGALLFSRQFELDIKMAPYRWQKADRQMADATLAGSALGNITPSTFTSTKQETKIFEIASQNDKGLVPGDYSWSPYIAYQVGSKWYIPAIKTLENNTSTSNIALALAGLKLDDSDHWQLDFLYRQTTGTSHASGVEQYTDMSGWVQAYLENRNNYMALVALGLPPDGLDFTSGTVEELMDQLQDLIVQDELTYTQYMGAYYMTGGKVTTFNWSYTAFGVEDVHGKLVTSNMTLAARNRVNNRPIPRPLCFA